MLKYISLEDEVKIVWVLYN